MWKCGLPKTNVATLESLTHKRAHRHTRINCVCMCFEFILIDLSILYYSLAQEN